MTSVTIFQFLCHSAVFKMNRIFWSLTLITLTIFPTDGLYCYQCMSLDCPGHNFREIGKEDPCEEVQEFAGRQIRNFYHFNTKSLISRCPEVDDEVQWRQLETTTSSCPGKAYDQTCSAGRLQIKTYYPDRPVMVSHATILGCAGVNLLNSIKNAKLKSHCDWLVRNGTSGTARYFHVLTMEHCSEVDTLCHQQDYCVAAEQSVVKPFVDPKGKLARFDYGLIIGIIAIVVVVFAAVIGASLCSFPGNKPTNLPTTNEDADLIRIRATATTRKLSGREIEDNLVQAGSSQSVQ